MVGFSDGPEGEPGQNILQHLEKSTWLVEERDVKKEKEAVVPHYDQW
jgi:hypothetical protein